MPACAETGDGDPSHELLHATPWSAPCRCSCMADFLRKISSKFFKKICHLLTGESGSINSATKSLICVSVSVWLCPKRGMLEQAEYACAL